ncbi:uncharacterized protein BJ212DRAFT_1372533 [Suillus subaureus]|uniref:Uncharacterized protein n=1 Tax=Suillus subaureus TaxID=48587 RepID=A0A9P7E633_9AGAM|nr:uncharacterized protein BJ212DRAFT_1372533 [Suillus subaureus]KAG1812245.1 hypothetical protein BJ212DRAFT_1372533 [Suillus subaureus]
MLMNSHQVFLTTWKPMLIPPQDLVLVVIFLCSLIAFPRSFTALHPMKRSKLRSHVHVRSVVAYLHSFALRRTLIEYLNFRNPQCLRD